MTLFQKAQEAARYIQGELSFSTENALVLGTGLTSIVDQEIYSISYSDIPHFPTSTVEGHSGKLIVASVNGNEVLVLSGRFHYYEGYNLQEVSFPIRVLKELGIQSLIITNVTGGLDPSYNTGDVVFVRDHINLLPSNPLQGLNDPNLGNRFPDMLEAYNKQLLAEAEKICAEHEIPYKTGVYVCLQGPSLETPAEYKFLNHIGADMVGMSTVPEVIVAKQCELKILVMSCISNVCYPPDRITETTIEEVIQVAQESSHTMKKVVAGLFNDSK